MLYVDVQRGSGRLLLDRPWRPKDLKAFADALGSAVPEPVDGPAPTKDWHGPRSVVGGLVTWRRPHPRPERDDNAMTRYWVDHGRLLFEERTSSLCYAVVAYGLVGALACLWFAAKLVWLPTIDDITGLPEPLSIADQALVAGLLAFAALHSMTLWLCCGTWVEVWEDGAVMMGFMFAAGERIWRGRIEDIEAFGHCHTADEYDPKDGGAPYVDVRHQGRLWLGAWTKESFECFAAALGRPVPEPIFEAHVRTQTWRNMRRIEQGSGKQRRTRATKAKSLSWDREETQKGECCE